MAVSTKRTERETKAAAATKSAPVAPKNGKTAPQAAPEIAEAPQPAPAKPAKLAPIPIPEITDERLRVGMTVCILTGEGRGKQGVIEGMEGGIASLKFDDSDSLLAVSKRDIRHVAGTSSHVKPKEPAKPKMKKDRSNPDLQFSIPMELKNDGTSTSRTLTADASAVLAETQEELRQGIRSASKKLTPEKLRDEMEWAWKQESRQPIAPSQKALLMASYRAIWRSEGNFDLTEESRPVNGKQGGARGAAKVATVDLNDPSWQYIHSHLASVNGVVFEFVTLLRPWNGPGGSAANSPAPAAAESAPASPEGDAPAEMVVAEPETVGAGF